MLLLNIITNLVAENNTNLSSYIFGVQKFKSVFCVLAELVPSGGFRKEGILLGVFFSFLRMPGFLCSWPPLHLQNQQNNKFSSLSERDPCFYHHIAFPESNSSATSYEYSCSYIGYTISVLMMILTKVLSTASAI